MKTRILGRSGPRVSEISLGSWLTFGSAMDARSSSEVVLRAVDLGVNLFDTADVYANGAGEEALGRALANVPRDRVVIGTKCFFPTSDAAGDRGLSREHVTRSVDLSLRRLGTDYIDLHQCHRADPETPLEETIGAYDDLIREGKVLHWGVSEWSGELIRAACSVADDTGSRRPISNQPCYSIMRRGLEADVLPISEAEGLGQIVFSPLGQGVLTGKYGGGKRPPGSRALDAQHNRWMGRYLAEDEVQRVERLRPLAGELGISLAQLALAWCLRHPSVASVIVGATGAAQLEENCMASGVALPEEITAAIDSIYPPPQAHRSPANPA